MWRGEKTPGRIPDTTGPGTLTCGDQPTISRSLLQLFKGSVRLRAFSLLDLLVAVTGRIKVHQLYSCQIPKLLVNFVKPHVLREML
jgi:hypothetical protein